MTKVIAGLTGSVDGFFADERGSIDRLYPDLADLRSTAYMRELVANTGAVLMGRRAFEMAEDPDWYVGNYELQVPIFVVTHAPPPRMPKQDQHLTFTFVTDGLASAVSRAKAAAAGRDVQVIGGISVVQQVLRAGLADELHIDVMPVLLGAGRRLFDDLDGLRLEKIDVTETGARTSLRFRVRKDGTRT